MRIILESKEMECFLLGMWSFCTHTLQASHLGPDEYDFLRRLDDGECGGLPLENQSCKPNICRCRSNVVRRRQIAVKRVLSYIWIIQLSALLAAKVSLHGDFIITWAPLVFPSFFCPANHFRLE